MADCIWYISKYVAPPPAQRRGARGYRLMRELGRRGYESVVITSDSFRPDGEPPLDTRYRLARQDDLLFCQVQTRQYKEAKSVDRILSFLYFEWRLLLMPKKNLPRPDAIVVSSLSLLTVLSGLVLSRRYGSRLVFEVRDIWPLTLTAQGGFSPSNPLVRGLGWIERLGYKKSDAIIGTMPNLAEHVHDVLGRDRPVFCVPMGIEGLPEPPTPADAAIVPWELIPTDRFLVTYTGSIGTSNALEPFFKCAETLSDNPDIHFLVVGEGDLRQGYIEEYGHLPNLTFVPRVPESGVQPVLSRSDLLYFSAHPSGVWRYGQSLNKLIDYMLAGKPIVASYTGYPSMINEADCGTFVPAGDVEALREEITRYAAMSQAERDAMGQRGRSWLMENRTYDKLADEFAAIALGSAPSTQDVGSGSHERQ